jgi:hypothetical protein
MRKKMREKFIHRVNSFQSGICWVNGYFDAFSRDW